MAKVQFGYADIKSIPLKHKRKLQEYLKKVFELEGKSMASLQYVFCSDDYLLEINKSYLQHDYFTDIITFDLSEDDCTIGEIYISIDRVMENSKVHQTSFQDEMIRVILHGALHLIGYKDKTKSEITKMREKEDYYLRLYSSN